jgi:cobalt-zinc-cadmium efflux system protein
VAIAGTYMVAEAVGGWAASSLAVLAHAGHMLPDVAALGVSLFAVRAAARPPSRAGRSFRNGPPGSDPDRV